MCNTFFTILRPHFNAYILHIIFTILSRYLARNMLISDDGKHSFQNADYIRSLTEKKHVLRSGILPIIQTHTSLNDQRHGSTSS
jgi:hypothetical protein